MAYAIPVGRVQYAGTKGAGSQSACKTHSFVASINRAKCFITPVHK